MSVSRQRRTKPAMPSALSAGAAPTSVKRRSRTTTADLPVSAVVLNLLERIQARLAAEEDPALRREVTGLLRPLERAVRRWVTVPPGVEQASACLDLLLELEARFPVSQKRPR